MVPDAGRPRIDIEGRHISSDSPCFFVAEAGTAHGGDLSRAKDLVDACAESGADCVKFQAVFAEEIVHPKSGAILLPGGKTQLFRKFLALEKDESFYAEIKSYAERRDLIFLCTPFGVKSAELLQRIGVAAIKIASPEINHLPLLDYCSSLGRPCIVSTGVSTLGDIENAVLRLRTPIALLHCVTSYPAPPEEYNVSMIENLEAIFGVPVGVSDHSIDPVLIPVLARLSGASIIEKHITLEISTRELDDPIALRPDGFAEMTREIGYADSDPTGALEALAGRFGEDTIERCIGDGVKRVAPSERGSYRSTNRSILAIRNIAPGERFTHENTALLRSETNIEPGLSPSMYKFVLARVARNQISSSEGIGWRDIGDQAPAPAPVDTPGVSSVVPDSSAERYS